MRRFERSFLCMQRKLTSVHLIVLERTRRLIGTADINATRRWDLEARTPTCQSLSQPGDLSALYIFSQSIHCTINYTHVSPVEKGYGVAESEHGLIILDIMMVQKLVDFLQLRLA